MLNEF